MAVGDIVKWIGFPGASISPTLTGPKQLGVIIKIYDENAFYDSNQRVDVMWASGNIGEKLYPQTIEVVNESR